MKNIYVKLTSFKVLCETNLTESIGYFQIILTQVEKIPVSNNIFNTHYR